MQETNPFFTQDFYEKHLSTINSIRFTSREIDVVACLLSARGTSKIASLLAVNPRTIETHVRNIMSKLECNSREGIIDFIEASNKLPFVRKYYSLLQNEILFEKTLKNIAKLNKDKTQLCLLTQGNDKDSFILHLKSHLEFAGFKVSIAAREKKGEYTLFVLPCVLADADSSSLLKKIAKSPNKVLLLQREKKGHQEMPQELASYNVVDFSKQENYFFDFFLLLSKLLPNLDLDKIIAQFKDKYKKDTTDSKVLSPSPLEKTLENPTISPRWPYVLSVCFLIALIGGGFLVFGWDQKNRDMSSVRSDLVIPVESTFLNRSELIAQIDNAFKAKEGIQSVALIGMGGAGKTTLARQYAHQQQAGIVWEINAETNNSLIESFDNFASALSTTEDDHKLLISLKEIKNSSEREKKLIAFVKERLRLHKNWFLIYDNVESFADIQQYFPLDAKTWGQGNVILTTRDSNFQNNKYVNHVFQIGKLNEKQKLELLTKIMHQGTKNRFTPAQILEAKHFLESIPPFPLDISAAAYYLKATHISYKKYLENLENYNQDFARVQENLLKEAGSYTKTRYRIISFSLEQLIKSHKDFGGLLLFVSFLDSQNIPRDLLNIYKGTSIVEDFIYHLKKYSLITNDFSSASEAHFSIHRSAQDISRVYLTECLKLNKESHALKDIISVLDDYADQIIEQEDISRMHIMSPHLKKILNNVQILTDFPKGLLESKLGSIYYFINDDKAREMLENSLEILQKKASESLTSADQSRLARSLLHIGAVYTELRLDKEAKEVLEKAIYLYRKEAPRNSADLSWALSHLGNLQRRLGCYEKAKDYLEESIRLHKQYGRDQKRIARTLAYLGGTYRGLGAYKEAIHALEESLTLYKEKVSNDHLRIGWPLIQLGNVYRRLGEPQKAKEYFERGILIFKKHLPENHMNMGLALACLGNCYRDLGDYEKSRHYLEQSLKIHQNYFDKNHRRMGWISFYLGSTYKAMERHQDAQRLFDKVFEIYSNDYGEENLDTADRLRNMAKICLRKNQLDDAEGFINRSLQIFQMHNHIETYRSLEVLGDIYLKKSLEPSYAQNKTELQNLKNCSLNKFNEALKIIEEVLPSDSIHIQRIKNKIKNVK